MKRFILPLILISTLATSAFAEKVFDDSTARTELSSKWKITLTNNSCHITQFGWVDCVSQADMENFAIETLAVIEKVGLETPAAKMPVFEVSESLHPLCWDSAAHPIYNEEGGIYGYKVNLCTIESTLNEIQSRIQDTKI